MNKPYRIEEHKCGCQSIMCGNESVLTTWDGLRNSTMTNKICEELNKAYEKGKNDSKPNYPVDDGGQSAVLAAGYGG